MASNYTESSIYSPFCPTGTILPYLGNVVPPGWAFCYTTPNIASKTLRASDTIGSTPSSNNTASITTPIIHSHNASTTGTIVSATHSHTIADYQPYSSLSNVYPNFDGTTSNNMFYGTGLATSNPYWNNNHAVTMGNTGAGQSFDILNTYFTVHWIIKL